MAGKADPRWGYVTDPLTLVVTALAAGATSGAGQAASAVVEAAQRLMALLDAAGTRAGKYTVDLRGAQGVQIGDHNEQRNRLG
jgi:hypothetical protein